MNLELSFLGGAGTVTGSRYLLHVDGARYLVDCGLFQGGRKLKAINWEPFPITPEKIDAVFLTHAHIDHSGYLPRLVKQGFQGPIFATEATCALLKILLPDSAYLQEQDAAYANKRGYSRHKPALPLYTVADSEDALGLLKPLAFDQSLSLAKLSVTWRRAGHILGSAILELDVDSRRVVFSGDLGRFDSEIMKPPAIVSRADVILIESTYGSRLHEDDSIEDVLTEIVTYVIESGGVLLIPAFSVGRTQQVLYTIRKLQDQGRIPDIPVYIDSPMAVEVSHIYCRFGDDHNLDVSLLMNEQMCPLRCKDTNFVQSVEESKALNQRKGPAVILSASGMCTGGRILHHLKRRLTDSRNAILFVGYQAEGTRGRLLLNGAERLKIHGESIAVNARVYQAEALSAHADRDELLRWLMQFKEPPQQTFIVHGEPESSLSLQDLIQQKIGWETIIPRRAEHISLA